MIWNRANESRLCAWSFQISGRHHMIEIEQAYVSGGIILWVNGEMLPIGDFGRLKPRDSLSFAILGCDCKLEHDSTIAPDAYRLFVNGRIVPTLGLHSETLLRPSSHPGKETELLRPAESVCSSDPDELLRPVEPDAGESANK